MKAKNYAYTYKYTLIFIVHYLSSVMIEKKAVIIFPHQCFEYHEALTSEHLIILAEDPYFFDRFSFHKQKLIFHRATLKAYEQFLIKKNFNVIYFDYQSCKKNLDKIFSLCKKNKISTLCYIDVIEKELDKKIKQWSKAHGLKVERYNTPLFLLTPDDLPKMIGTKKHYLMASFYTKMRKLFKILLHDGKPTGGKWSFDAENRKPLTKGVIIPKIPKNNSSSFVKEAKVYVEKNFPKNPGDTDTFVYPVTHDQAKDFLNNFFENKFAFFGPYQDAIDSENPFTFHSIISPLLNTGLLTTKQVIDAAITFGSKNKIKINSIEGFVRQILGWREFVRGIYELHGSQQKNTNFLNHRFHLPKTFWNGTTNIEPLDNTIRNILKFAYAHHIERLMVLGNFMLISHIQPNDVYRWFMEMFIDSYDWVMIPNVYGMSQYADGGLMTTKPYCSSSRYILSMSNYQKGKWCAIWDALYWNFIYKNAPSFKKNQRLSFVLSALKKMKPSTLKSHLQIAESFLKNLR